MAWLKHWTVTYSLTEIESTHLFPGQGGVFLLKCDSSEKRVTTTVVRTRHARGSLCGIVALPSGRIGNFPELFVFIFAGSKINRHSQWLLFDAD